MRKTDIWKLIRESNPSKLDSEIDFLYEIATKIQ